MAKPTRPSPYHAMRRLDAEAERTRRNWRRLHYVLVVILFVAYSAALVTSEREGESAGLNQTDGKVPMETVPDLEDAASPSVKGQASSTKSAGPHPKGGFHQGTSPV